MLWVLVVALGAAPQLTVAAPGLHGVGFEPDRLAFFSEHLAQAVTSSSVRVVTERELAALLGLERQKQLLGCADSTACFAELGNALGAQAVLLGDVGRIGKRVHVNLKVIATSDGKLLARQAGKADSDEELADLFAQLGRALHDELLASQGLAPVSAGVAQTTVRSNRPLAIIPAALGLIGAGVGTALLVVSTGLANQLKSSAHLSDTEAQNARTQGPVLQAAGLVCIAVGGAALVAALAVFVFGGPFDALAGLAVSNDGAAVTLGWRLP